MDSLLIERQIIKKILNKEYENILPSERELSLEFNVTRQKIREILQRLKQDGWIEIQHGKSTRVKFIFEEGGLSILNSLIKHNILELPELSLTTEEFIVKLLEIRYALSPIYTENCLNNNPDIVIQYLSNGFKEKLSKLKNNPKEITNFDWHLHRILCKYSNNIIYLFLLNSFKDIYFHFGVQYFSLKEARERSIKFYKDFLNNIKNNQIEAAILEMKKVTKESIDIIKIAFSIRNQDTDLQNHSLKNKNKINTKGDKSWNIETN
jgi:GntR family negative regulator for fad regulon and positive regulator of fabA